MLVAPGRASRPGATGRTTRVDDAARCPFCEGHEAMTPPETAALGRPRGAPVDAPGWTVRVVPNKYPAFPGHEVVVHGPRHVLSFGDLEPSLAATVVEAWRQRRAAHEAAGARSVLTAINEGPAAGASLDHSHSQIVPFAQAPPAIAREQAAFLSGCPLCRRPANVVRDRDGLTTFCPDFARVPFETWIAPETHQPRAEMGVALAAALLDAVTRLRGLLGRKLAWNAILHEAPIGADTFHWHVEILPRLTVAAAIELGAGIWVNVVDPASAAAELGGAARG